MTEYCPECESTFDVWCQPYFCQECHNNDDADECQNCKSKCNCETCPVCGEVRKPEQPPLEE